MRLFANKKFDRAGTDLVNVGTRVTGDLTATSTDKFWLPLMNRRAAVTGFSVSTDTLPINAGTNTAILYKYDASADAAVALTAATDLETLVTMEGRKVDLIATLTDAQRTLDDGDTLYVETTQSGAQTQQPTNLCFAAELAVLE